MDGLRGLAIAGVLAYHGAPSLARGGYLGVEVFFVLSGYLLTSRLVDQHRRHGEIEWGRYLRQRVRRLAPALGVFLMAVVVLGAVAVRSDAYRLRADVLWSALGLTNWHLISDGSSYFRQLGRPPLVRHLWSLAVEIQFYAAIPLLVAGLLRWSRRRSVAALCAGIGLSTLVMAVLYRSDDPSRAYYGTDARLGALLAGVLLAVVLLPGEGRREPPRWLGWAGSLGLVALGGLFMVAGEGSGPVFLGGFLVCRLATALAIAGALQPGRCAGVLAGAVPSWLGRRSYSIYLWHWPLLVLLRPGVDVAWPPVVAVGVALTAALVIGHLSYELVERPFLRRRLASPVAARGPVLTAAGWTNAAVATTATAVLLFSLPSADPIADSLREGQQVLASQRSTPAPPPAPEVTTTAPAAPAPEAAPAAAATPPPGPPSQVVAAIEPRPAPVLPAGPAPGTVRVTAIGDSVMLSAAGPLHMSTRERNAAGRASTAARATSPPKLWPTRCTGSGPSASTTAKSCMRGSAAASGTEAGSSCCSNHGSGPPAASAPAR
ncbi:MAG: acyltransferase [Actinobacteria bacterium]|nr:acyltransferase [Actinomycetota bacterium]